MTSASALPAIGVGAVFPARRCDRTAADQRHIHLYSGIEIEDQRADPILMLLPGIRAIGEALAVRHSAFGAVITKQKVTIKKRSLIGARSTLSGRVVSFEEVSRGALFTTLFAVTDEGEETLVEMATTMMLIDPSKAAPDRGKGVETAPTEREDSRTLWRFQFSPEATRQFELGGPPSLHTDEALARAAGFPKPIVAGNQIFSILWKRYVEPRYALPVSLDLSLKRPVFWDEAISFEHVLTSPMGNETLEVRKANGKVAIQCEITGQIAHTTAQYAPSA